jgi:hypothetical protein
MFSRFKSYLERSRFSAFTIGILDTAPVPVVDAPFSIMSMVSNRDVQMYLIAIKSFYSRMRRGKIVAIIDRDMPNRARRTLQQHLPGIRFTTLEDIDTRGCQRGGTWERLLCVLEHAEHEYTIQLDADTLTFGAEMDEVVRCVENNIAFTMPGMLRTIRSLPEAAEDARNLDSTYVGILAERFFDRYPGAEALRYVRASSGFAGFATGAFPRARIVEFHGIMENFMGDAWKKWGTEQCASNFAVANSPGGVVLPFPKYACFNPYIQRGKSSFLHFIGSYRYLDDYFAQCARDEIARLKNGPKPSEHASPQQSANGTR